jgi:hypothetical protein
MNSCTSEHVWALLVTIGYRDITKKMKHMV